MNWLIRVLGLSLTLPLQAEPGSLITLSGERIGGEVRLEGDGKITVQPAEGAPRKVELKDLAEATFKIEVPPPAPPLPKLAEEQPNKALPPAWKSQDIGKVKQSGSVTYTIVNKGRPQPSTAFSFRSCGMDLEAKNDSCHFLYQTLKGNGDVLAHVAGVHNSDRLAMAGVMIRAGLAPTAASAAMVATPSEGGYFVWREKNETDSRNKNIREPRYAPWLKLARRGNEIAAYRSKDGVSWEQVELAIVELPETIWIGAVCTSGKEGVFNYTQITDLQVMAAANEAFVPKLVLRDRTTLAGQFLAADAPNLRFVCHGKTLVLNTGSVARLIFGPVNHEVEARLKPGKSGLLTRKGEFVEGTLLGVEAGLLKCKMRSGPASLRAGNEVVAVILNEAVAEAAQFELRTSNGDVAYASQLSAGQNSVTVELAGVGTFVIPREALTTIRRIGNLAGVAELATLEKNHARLKIRDGRVLTGELQFLNGRVLLAKGEGRDQSWPLNEVQQILRLDETSGDSAIRQAGQWLGTDVGAASLRGAYRFAKDGLTIEGAGEDIQKNRDSFYFVHQVLERSGEIVARLSGWQNARAAAKAGLMMRDRLEPNSRNVLVAVTPAKQVFMQQRASSSGSTDSLAQQETDFPLWLKLAREGRAFSGSYSTDGKKWYLLSRQNLDMPDKLYVGLVVASRDPKQLVQAMFDNIAVRRTSVVDFKPVLVLRSGSEIPSAIYQADDTTVKFVRVQREELSVSTLNVARIYFQPVTAELGEALTPGRHGVLMKNGDFIDGEFKSLDRDSVKISSLLFGLRSYKLMSSAVAIILRDALPEPPAFELRLQDGSKILAHDARLRDDRLEIKEAALGDLAISARELVEFKRNAPSTKGE
jgi:regulation of enolase protein 1 (concanavalin A-like superfamily)